MIFGECPYCDYPAMIGVPDDISLPVFGLVTCDRCGKEFWERYSRWDPEAYTQEAFAEKFVVDEATRAITARA